MVTPTPPAPQQAEAFTFGMEKVPATCERSLTVAEPIAWESTTICYTRFVSDRRYRLFSPKVQGWYKPYRCANCAALSASRALAQQDAKS